MNATANTTISSTNIINTNSINNCISEINNNNNNSNDHANSSTMLQSHPNCPIHQHILIIYLINIY